MYEARSGRHRWRRKVARACLKGHRSVREGARAGARAWRTKVRKTIVVSMEAACNRHSTDGHLHASLS
eukprot:6203891-Pleurochrysis_carterae.AAC.2